MRCGRVHERGRAGRVTGWFWWRRGRRVVATMAVVPRPVFGRWADVD